MPTPPTTLVQKKIEELKKYLSDEQTVAQKEGTTWQEKEKLVLVNILEISKNMLESLANTNQPTNTYKSIESYIDQIRGQLGNLSDVTRTNFKNRIAALLISIDAAIMPSALVGASGKPRSQPIQTIRNTPLGNIPNDIAKTSDDPKLVGSASRAVQQPTTTITSVTPTNSTMPANELAKETIISALQQRLTTLESLLARKTKEQQELQQTVLNLQSQLEAQQLEQQKLKQEQSVKEERLKEETQDLSTKLQTANGKIDQFTAQVRDLQDSYGKLESTSQTQALQVDQLDKKISALSAQNTELQKKVNPLERRIETLAKQVDAANQSLKKSNADNEQIRREMGGLKKQLDTLQNANQVLQSKLQEEIKKNKEESDAEIKRLQQTIQNLNARLDTKTTALNFLSDDYKTLTSTLKTETERFAQEKQKLERQIDTNKTTSDDAIANLLQKIDTLNKSNETRNTTIQERNAEIAKLNAYVNQLQDSNSTQQKSISALKQELDALKTRQASQTNAIQTDNSSLKKELEQIIANNLDLQERIQALEEQQQKLDTREPSNAATEQPRNLSPNERLKIVAEEYSPSTEDLANVVTPIPAIYAANPLHAGNIDQNGWATDIASPLTQNSLIIYNQNEQKFLFNKAKITELIPSLSPKKDGALDKTQPIDVETTQEQVSFEGDKRDDNVFKLLQGMSTHNDEIKKDSANFTNNQHLLCAAAISVPDDDSMLQVLSKIYNEVTNPEDITVKVLIKCNNPKLNEETEEMIRLHNTIVKNINENETASIELIQIKEKLNKADSDNAEQQGTRPRL